MKRFIKTTIIFAFLIPKVGFASDEGILDTCLIETQINHVYDKANIYNDYKTVKVSTFKKLKQNLLDTIGFQKENNRNALAHILNQDSRIDSLQKVISNNQETINKLERTKNSFSLFGLSIKKGKYNTLMWTVTFSLAAGMIIFLLLYKSSRSLNNRFKNDYLEAKSELENFRRRAREREEKIVRSLHDEINRYKKKLQEI